MAKAKDTAAGDEAPKSVKVEALKYHTNSGSEYEVGDTYEVPEDEVDNLVIQGMAARVDRVKVSKEAREAADKAEATRRKGAVEPLGTKRAGRSSRRSR